MSGVILLNSLYGVEEEKVKLRRKLDLNTLRVLPLSLNVYLSSYLVYLLFLVLKH